MTYKLTPAALSFLLSALKDKDQLIELMKILKIKEAQIKKVIKENSGNGILTLFAMIEFIKDNSTLRTESKILETVYPTSHLEK